MRINFLEISGFRGFRDKVRVEFGGGFTVITGRNGVGKSTLCDAIEFAITGTIDKYTVEKAAKENLIDYLWWRGELKQVLGQHATELRAAGTKAWNVYSLFLTAETAPDQARAIERIEEDFEFTRKIARESVRQSAPWG